MKPVVRSLTLKGFRSFDSARIEFDNPTFLVGQNGAGKSNVVNALAFMAEAMTSPLDSVINRRGGISVLCHRPPFDGVSHFGLALELEIPSEGISSAQYGFEVQALPQRGFQVTREQCVIMGSGGRIYFARHEDPVHGSVTDSSFANLIPLTDSTSLVLPIVGGHRAFAPVVRTIAAMLAYSIEPTKLRQVQEPNGNSRLKADGSNAASVLLSLRSDFPGDFSEINEFMSVLLPYKTEVHPVEVGDKLWLEFVEEGRTKEPITLSALSMSDGALRTLGLLLAAYQKPTPSLIALEDPEATIHPGALGIILDVIRIISYRSQAVITTHSSELLDSASWIEDRHLRVVYRDGGASRVSLIGKTPREVLQEHLMGAGELLRSNLLDIDSSPTSSGELDLFGILTPAAARA
ncbi:MAG: AAA family ATPase [Acidobacteria bacterium]|nr:AAA family ATPase [Acidobacteriota bacterium]